MRKAPITAGLGSYVKSPVITLWAKYGSKILIGNYTSVASHVTFMLGGHHPTDCVTTHPFGKRDVGYSKGDIVIGSDCWIGHGAVILDGVTIGDGAVVGAFAVVAGNVNPYAIVVGNPARVIRYRFTTDVIARLLHIRWWDWEPSRIRMAREYLRGNDIEEFFRRFGDDDQ